MKIKLLGLLLVFAGILYWQDSTSDDAMDKYIEEYKVFQAKADSVTELADSLKEEIIIADNESRAAESRAKVLSRQVNVLKNETLNMEERAEVMKETLLDTLELARQNNRQIEVPIIYGSPEKWKAVQADGYYRDGNQGKIMVPLIMFQRESITKDRSIGNKLDGNKVRNFKS